MAAGVSIITMMLLPLLLMMTAALAPPVSSYPTRSVTNDPFIDYKCPVSCACFKITEVTGKLTSFVNCTVPFFSPHLKEVINLMANPLIGIVHFRCSYSGIDNMDTPPESFLWEEAFLNLGHLSQLKFSNCKFRKLSKDNFRGLVSLTTLTIQDATIDDLDPYLLTSLPNLNILEISYSALTKLFPLCSARSLRGLNISGNHFTSLEESGLHCSSGPLRNIEILDAHRNLLTDIPSWLGPSLPNLHHLAVPDNVISQIDESAFSSFSQLVYLDISNNSITYLSPKIFRNNSIITILSLATNPMSVLPSNLLSSLTDMLQLELGEMDLDNRVWGELTSLNQLLTLNVSHNALTEINSNIMSQFSKLEELFLQHNSIISFSIEAFVWQYNLARLDLSYNEITSIPREAFRSQIVLKDLHLHHNNISSIGEDAFSKLEDLVSFDMSYNNVTTLPENAFGNLMRLTKIDLSANNIKHLDKAVFIPTRRLQHINVSYNSLTDMPLLNDLPYLTIVDFSHNNITLLLPTLFVGLRELKSVALNHNSIENLPIKLFNGCDRLTNIDLSFNAIKQLDEATFSSAVDLRVINLSHNEIFDIGNVFSGLKHLEYLDLSYNKITKVLRGQFPPLIEHIDLNTNQITSLGAHTFKSLNQIRTVDLSSNKLQSLDRMDVEIAFNMSYNPTFKIQFNPFVCDCNLGWLKDLSMGKLKDMMTLPNFNYFPRLRCKSPFYTWDQDLQSLQRSEFLCNYTQHCEETCMCCDYNACYCKYICPTSCECYIGDEYWHVHHVRCSSVGLTTIPEGLPEGATNLHLDGNDIQTLTHHAFLAMMHVEVLYLNHSRIESIENSTFRGLKSTKRLYLNNNKLTTLYAATFKDLQSLEQLYLYNNDIIYIESNAFLEPPYLILVHLQGNLLVTMPIEELWGFTNRTIGSQAKAVLYLGGNPWSCELDFACKFLHFLQVNTESVEDISYIECVPPSPIDKPNSIPTHSTLLLDFQLGLCADNLTIRANSTRPSVADRSSRPKSQMYALIAACVVIVFAIALLIVAYFNRHLLQVLCFTKFGLRMFKMAKATDDSERPYDAFISYSNKDEEFVIRQLAPRLENGDKKFHLCVHYRDFPVGASIAETIVRSVEASKRTILVVSDNFLDSEWCRFEFQTAHQQVLSERRNRVILILMHDLDTDKLDSTLKVYMRTRTYLKYEDPWFWEKLMFAMPDIRHRKLEQPVRLPSSRDLEYMARDRRLSEQQQYQLLQQQHQQQLQQQMQNHPHNLHHHHHNPRPRTACCRPVGPCDSVHSNDMYEIPVLDSPSIHYHLANGACCSSTHTNSAYHNSDGSDSTSGYHNGSVEGSFVHYEEVGPGSSIQSTPQKLVGNPPPVPLIPKEGFVPREKLKNYV